VHRGVESSQIVKTTQQSVEKFSGATREAKSKSKEVVEIGGDDRSRGSSRHGEFEDLDDAGRAELAERRLLEAQQVLVQERLAREVTEAMLQETAKALSAVRKAAVTGNTAATTGVPLQGSDEHQRIMLQERLKQVKTQYQELNRKNSEKDAELESLRRLVQTREKDFDLIGERPVTVNVNVRDMTNADQEDLVLASKDVLDQASEQARAVEQLREVEEAKLRALGDLVTTMESRQSELKEKLADAGLLDEAEYNDAKVLEKAGAGAHMGHLGGVAVRYDGPATSPLGKNFYVTRKVSFWDRWFGIWA